MSKLTPPQNPTKRARFFLAHPEHPKAAAEIAAFQDKLGRRAFNEWRQSGGTKDLKKITDRLSREFFKKGKTHDKKVND